MFLKNNTFIKAKNEYQASKVTKKTSFQEKKFISTEKCIFVFKCGICGSEFAGNREKVEHTKFHDEQNLVTEKGE